MKTEKQTPSDHRAPGARRSPESLRAERFGHLPRRIDPAETVETKPASPAKDPDFGRNPDRDWLVRYCA